MPKESEAQLEDALDRVIRECFGEKYVIELELTCEDTVKKEIERLYNCIHNIPEHRITDEMRRWQEVVRRLIVRDRI